MDHPIFPEAQAPLSGIEALMPSDETPESQAEGQAEHEEQNDVTQTPRSRRRFSFSSEDFPKYWRYAIGTDFQSADGEPAQYASGHPKYRNTDEAAKLTFDKAVSALAVNSDGTLLAIAEANAVHIYRVSDRTLVKTLRGHLNPVGKVAWHPSIPHEIVTFADADYVGIDEDEDDICQQSQILFWDVSDDAESPHDIDMDAISRQAVTALQESIARLRPARQEAAHAADQSDKLSAWSLSASDSTLLEKKITKILQRFAIKASISHRPSLHGRLISLSPSGTSLLILPEERQQSNGDAPWDLHVVSYANKSVTAILRGHRDYIAWADFSPSSALVGTASWDGTFRIFDAVTGETVRVFEAPDLPQNWAGKFSPDETMFAGTMGNGHFAVWDIESGEKLASLEVGGWWRTMDWSRDSRFLAVGSNQLGRIMVIEPRAVDGSKQVVQNRQLSVDRCIGSDFEDIKPMLGGFLEVRELKFVGSENLLAYRLTNDLGLELYDFESNRKWRFAPKASDFGMQEGDETDTREWGGTWVFLDRERRIVSADGKTVRFWDVEDA